MDENLPQQMGYIKKIKPLPPILETPPFRINRAAAMVSLQLRRALHFKLPLHTSPYVFSSANYAEEDRLQGELMPRHVAIIMDPHERIADRVGFRALGRIVDLCCKWGIRVLTVFAFSTHNWFRPKLTNALI